MALEIAVPAGQAKSVAKNSDRLQDAMDGLRDTQRLGRIVETIEGASQKAGQGKRIAKDQFSRGVRGGLSVGQGVARDLLSRAPTAGTGHRLTKILQRSDVASDDLEDLSPSERRAVSDVVQRGGPQVGRAIADGGPDAFARLRMLDAPIPDELKQSLASYVARHRDDLRANELSAGQLDADLQRLGRVDGDNAPVDGFERLVRNIAVDDPSNVVGHARTARVAARLDSVDDVRVSRVDNEVESSIGSTEIDVELERGSTVEVKSGRLAGEESVDQLRRQLAYREEAGLSGNHYVDADEIGPRVENYMETNNIERIEDSTPFTDS